MNDPAESVRRADDGLHGHVCLLLRCDQTDNSWRPAGQMLTAAVTYEQRDSNDQEAASDKSSFGKKETCLSNFQRSFGGISVKTKGCSCEQTCLLQQTVAAVYQMSSPHRRWLLFIGMRLDPEIKCSSLSTMAVLASSTPTDAPHRAPRWHRQQQDF